MYRQWICWLPKVNREAEPLSGGVSFGRANPFISVERPRRLFQAGLQVERGQLTGPAHPGTLLQEDWDWHRLIGGFEDNLVLDRASYASATRLAAAARKTPSQRFGGFQLCYPMPARELRRCSGYDLVRAALGVFAEVVPAMNLCMPVPLAVH